MTGRGADTFGWDSADRLTSATVAGTKSWLHDDALGSVRFTTNSSGASIGSSTYDAFGSQRSVSGQQSLFRFAGQEQHGDLGLIHMRARWYDPQIGRFISRDPIKGSATAPQSLNLYAYGRNQPTGLRDPSPLCCLDRRAGRDCV